MDNVSRSSMMGAITITVIAIDFLGQVEDDKEITRKAVVKSS